MDWNRRVEIASLIAFGAIMAAFTLARSYFGLVFAQGLTRVDAAALLVAGVAFVVAAVKWFAKPP